MQNMKDKVTIGRAGTCDIRIGGEYGSVSGSHADIINDNGRLVFVDHSTNGTEIDGKEVHNAQCVVARGAKIVLAGVYELPWAEIEKYFPSRKTRPFNPDEIGGRPTKPFAAGAQSEQTVIGEAASRKTKPFAAGASSEQTVKGNAASRETKLFAAGVSSEQTVKGNAASRETKPFDGQAAMGGQAAAANAGSGRQQSSGRTTGVYHTQAEIDAAKVEWNWGAFLCGWIWAVRHKLYWPVLIIPVTLIPYVGQVCGLVLSVYLGLNGSQMALSSGLYGSFDDYLAANDKWRKAGVLVFIVSALASLMAFYYMTTY